MTQEANHRAANRMTILKVILLFRLLSEKRSKLNNMSSKWYQLTKSDNIFIFNFKIISPKTDSAIKRVYTYKYRNKKFVVTPTQIAFPSCRPHNPEIENGIPPGLKRE